MTNNRKKRQTKKPERSVKSMESTPAPIMEAPKSTFTLNPWRLLFGTKEEFTPWRVMLGTTLVMGGLLYASHLLSHLLPRLF